MRKRLPISSLSQSNLPSPVQDEIFENLSEHLCAVSVEASMQEYNVSDVSVKITPENVTAGLDVVVQNASIIVQVHINDKSINEEQVTEVNIEVRFLDFNVFFFLKFSLVYGIRWPISDILWLQSFFYVINVITVYPRVITVADSYKCRSASYNCRRQL